MFRSYLSTQDHAINSEISHEDFFTIINEEKNISRI